MNKTAAFVNKTTTFKEFLTIVAPMTKEQVRHFFLSEAVKKKKKIPKPKPRPKKNLWFQDRNLWHADLQFVHGAGFNIHRTDEENEEDKDYYATGQNNKLVWGVWKGKQKRGITFHKPRHLNNVKHPRVELKPFDMPSASANNITSRPVNP